MDTTLVCRVCGVQKPISAFRKDRSKRLDVRNLCRSCASERGKEYYRNHAVAYREAKATARKKQTVEQREVKREYDHQYYIRHKNRLLQQNRNRYSARRQKDQKLRGLYGITILEYERLGEHQGWKCAICGREMRNSLVMDHDHITGKPRGLLCHVCNSGLGFLQDSVTLLESALTYVKRYAKTT